MRGWNRSEIIALLTLIIAMLACIANWIVVPGFRNMFNNRGLFVYAIPYVLGFASVGFLIAMIVWHYRKPSLPEPNDYVSNLNDDNNRTGSGPVEPSINAVGTQLIYAGPDKIIIWTTIKLIDSSGRERYLRNLTANNFTITESFSGETHKASIVELKSSDVPVKAILVIDKSGSMAGSSGVNKSTKIDVAKDATTFFFNQLTTSNDNLIAVLPFSGDEVVGKNFLKNENGGIWLNHRSKNLLVRSLKHLKADGRTPLWQSISHALEQFSSINEESYKLIICLSDGINNVGSVSFETLINNAREKQIPIFTVGYGGGNLNSHELVQLSKDSGAGKENAGSFMQVPPKDWSNRLNSIGTGITNLYEIYWNPTGKVPGTRVAVQIDINYELDGKVLKTTERRSYVLP